MSTGEEKFEVGFHSWSFASLPLDEALRHIRDTGFDEAEIEADMLHLDPRFFPRCKLPDLRRLLQDLSLHPSSVHAPFSGVDLSAPTLEERKQTLDLLVDTLEFCKVIECSTMVVHPNHSDSLPIGPQAMKKNSIEALKRLIDKAEELGVKIALENMIDKGGGRFESRVADLREVINDLGSLYVGICLDTGHTNLLPSYNVSQGEEIAQAGKYLWTLHIHDNDGVEDRHWPPGDGNVDWGQVIRSLRKVNYRSVFMMEIQEAGNPDRVAKRCLQRAKQILARSDPK